MGPNLEVLVLAPLRKTTKARNKLENSSSMHRASRGYSTIVESPRAVGTDSPREYGMGDVTSTRSFLVVTVIGVPEGINGKNSFKS